MLGLAQYEPVLLDAGYDDIDFISEITAEELRDINITKKGESRQCLVGCVCMVVISCGGGKVLTCVQNTLLQGTSSGS